MYMLPCIDAYIMIAFAFFCALFAARCRHSAKHKCDKDLRIYLHKIARIV